MLQHAHADNTVKLHAGLRKVPVVHQLYGNKTAKPFLFNPLCKSLILLTAQGDSGSLYPIFLCGPD